MDLEPEFAVPVMTPASITAVTASSNASRKPRAAKGLRCGYQFRADSASRIAA
jgi:hypothetical protein